MRDAIVVYKKVLVALGATTCRESVAEALTITADQDVQLRFVHVIDVMISGAEGFNIEPVYAARQREGKAILEAAFAQAREANVTPEGALIDGEGRRVSIVLLQEILRWGADLLVIGGRARRNLLARLLFDDVCDAIISSAPVPILLAARPGANGLSRKKSTALSGAKGAPDPKP
jgi:nucleotide-binding universal stress UspA family protein